MDGSYLFGQVREQERARLAGLSAQFDRSLSDIWPVSG